MNCSSIVCKRSEVGVTMRPNVVKNYSFKNRSPAKAFWSTVCGKFGGQCQCSQFTQLSRKHHWNSWRVS